MQFLHGAWTHRPDRWQIPSPTPRHSSAGETTYAGDHEDDRHREPEPRSAPSRAGRGRSAGSSPLRGDRKPCDRPLRPQVPIERTDDHVDDEVDADRDEGRRQSGCLEHRDVGRFGASPGRSVPGPAARTGASTMNAAPISPSEVAYRACGREASTSRRLRRPPAAPSRLPRELGGLHAHQARVDGGGNRARTRAPGGSCGSASRPAARPARPPVG